MRLARSATLLTVGLLAAAGLPAGTAAAAEPTDTIHVSRTCATNADGSEQAPYCSISAAAAVVQPGQTILVGQGNYTESVAVPSGAPGKPVTIKGVRSPTGRAHVYTTDSTSPMILAGVHDVVIDGIEATSGVVPAVVVEGSTDVVLTNGWARAVLGTSVDIRGDSRRVTISGMSVEAPRGTSISVGAGVTDTMLAGNSMRTFRAGGELPSAPAIVVTDAPRTTLTNNTIATDCADGVVVTGASTGFGLYNTIVRTRWVGSAADCNTKPIPDPANVLAVSVASTAVADSHVDYNVIDPVPGGPSYSWGGTTYPNPAAFNVATGQGAHDIGADAKLGNPGTAWDLGWSIGGDSPAVDSAWTDAPGRPAIDLRGNARADKPDAPNTGGGFVDRGASELLPTPTYRVSTGRAHGPSPLETRTTITATYPWVLDGPVGYFSFAAAGQQTIVNRTGTARFTFDHPGRVCVDVESDLTGFRSRTSSYAIDACVLLGASFNAVAPQRVLSTKAGIGLPRTTPLGPQEEIELPLPAPAATSSAVVLNVTVTNPTTNGYLKVYPDTEPTASNINFSANQTIPNLVSVPVVNGRVKIKNGSAGTVHVLADLAGYYANAGFGLTNATQARVLDTRAAVGVPGTTPVGPNGRVTVDISSRVPVGTTAVVLNVAVTKPTGGGHLTAFPPGSAVPTASNLNFVTGQTANNMVIAPVVDRKISFAYGGSGTVHVIADLNAYFAPGVADTYLPVAPKRILDTREPGSTAVGPGETRLIYTDALLCVDHDVVGCRHSALVANLTVTGTQSPGYLTVFPNEDGPRPTTSVINFNKGDTIANLITIKSVAGFFWLYNSSAGTVHVVVDQAGYYLQAPTA
ncbi:Protein of unknown function [Asanoa ishikariensis]|uniref:Uncharacterized protein n=2 Tax=Asanoa ishikariensis TaxID=137265 RepID=A0A1H3L5W1_9ACTN|nr:Protein of unknown function [Asanoa ishikariensis]